MTQNLVNFINELKKNIVPGLSSEAETKLAVILPILQNLSWNVFNVEEIKPEYSVGSGRVDFALIIKGQCKVFIEAKPIGEDLSNHQEQLLKYSFQEGVPLSVLTNGITWWFYLSTSEVPWERRRFFTIDILEQECQQVIEKFSDFLSKENISSGDAIKNANLVLKNKQKIKIIEETIPKAWTKIIDEPDERLIELINETVEKICGLKAEPDVIVSFIKNISETKLVPSINVLEDRKTIKKDQQQRLFVTKGKEDYTNKTPLSFIFKGKEVAVKSFINLLVSLSNELLDRNPKSFEAVLILHGRKRKYFSRNKNELYKRIKLRNSDIWVETNLNANIIVDICRRMLHILGYSGSDLKIITK